MVNGSRMLKCYDQRNNGNLFYNVEMIQLELPC